MHLLKHNLQIVLMILIMLTVNLTAQSKGGYWTFDNDSNDTADWDQINDKGSLLNDAHYSSLDPVQNNDAYLCLDSIDAHDIFQVQDSEDLDFDNENIGISAWIKPVVISGVHFLITKGVQDANPKTTNYALRISKTKNLEFLIRDANNKAQVVSSSFTIPLGQWTFIAAFYDFTAKKVYFWNKAESNPADTVGFDFDYFSNNDPLAIGAWAMNDPVLQSNSDFEGSIDDVRISGRLPDIIPVLSSVGTAHEIVNSANSESVNIYPNPASLSGGRGQIEFQLSSAGANSVNYIIYNILGQKVFQGSMAAPAGFSKIQWRMKDQFGQLVNTGVYFVEFRGMRERMIRKFLVIR